MSLGASVANDTGVKTKKKQTKKKKDLWLCSISSIRGWSKIGFKFIRAHVTETQVIKPIYPSISICT